ncbi:putative holin-like toxin [Companilactobacillus sp.]|nr:putative holin-like toxin [Companilactobacillus sp.]MCH4009309.1 putative holin-like toxin [Companilactobacillus sp.]MCH4050512.1 putative holin-like toxin [Companilactobacillus sp.]MCH4077251.1 putative holin-like toxin [Companilactobacillus sp.]MCH4125827.1 putative holin-like toxin [Companilactobacillus sp.]MCI1311536.1 putative holin-like toxin [Companilactobacillus sp.]
MIRLILHTTPPKEMGMSVYQSLMLMIAFATLVVLILKFNRK